MRAEVTYLVADDGLLYRGEVLQRGEQDMTPLRTSNVLDEASELLAQSDQDLILILDGFCGGRVSDNVDGGSGSCGDCRTGTNEPSRKGISSSRVRSAPRARAMVERR